MSLTKNIIRVVILFPFLCSGYAKTDEKDQTKSTDKPPEIGNFSIPVASQQPGPLLSLGQNIIDKNETQAYLLADKFSGDDKYTADAIPSILYGISDDFSIYLSVPVAVSYKDHDNKSSGFEDAFVQLEYAYYSKTNSEYSDQATILGNMTIPFGASTHQPPIGFGAPSFFLGTTFSRLYTDWYLFTSYGALLPTQRYETQLGNQFLYQAGFGKNIIGIPGKWIVTWVVEIDGLYSQRNKIEGETDPNSGGNIIYVTPSIWIASERLVLQLGAGVPATQHSFGEQTRSNYLLIGNIGWVL